MSDQPAGADKKIAAKSDAEFVRIYVQNKKGWFEPAGAASPVREHD